MKFRHFVTYLGLMIALDGCRTPRVEKIVQEAPTNPVTSKISWTANSRGTLPLSGENCCARFSNDDRQIIYLSRNRQRHRHWQVYSFDLDYHTEKRLSFHDGDDQGPSLDPKGHFFVYASLTDFIKEEPTLWRQALGRPASVEVNLGPRFLWSGQPFEIYLSTFEGQIQRLTENELFDGEASLDSNGRNLIYLRAKEGSFQIIRQSVDSRNGSILISSRNALSEPSLSPNGQRLAFVQFSEDRQSSQIMMADANGRRPQALTSSAGHREAIRWTRDGKYLLFSQRANSEEPAHIYQIRPDGSCSMAVTSGEDFETSPDLSLDGQRLLLSAKIRGEWQIRLLDFHPGTCPDAEVTGLKASPKLDP